MAERHGRMLAELSELGLGLARDLQGRALAAEGPQEAAQLAEAFHRISRSVRQSLALEAKLTRDAARNAREDQEIAARETEVRRTARKAQLQKRLVRLIWDEVETPELAAALVREAPDFIEREAEAETFLDEPVEAQIARIRETLGVDEAWDLDEDAPEDTLEDDPEDTSQDTRQPHPPPDPAAAAEPAPSPPRAKPPWPTPYDDRCGST